jgi:CRP-like cAMP-binding protein
MDKTLLLQFIDSTIPIPHEKARAIADAFSPRSLKKGEQFLAEGKVSNEYLFLDSGFLRSYVIDTEGNEVTLNFFAKAGVVFEVASFFQRISTQENIEALTDSEGWVLTYEQLNTLFHTVPEFRDFGRAVLVKGFIAFKNRTFAMINKTAEQRYEALLSSNPEILRHAPLKYIASYLGITDSSLSRIRRESSRK